MELKNRTLSNFAELVRTGECKKFRGRLKVGVDLGTANTVLAVVDSTNRPIAGVSAPSHAIRDGVIVNYYESVQLVTKLKEELEEVKGLFRGKERKSSESRIANAQERLSSMKAYLNTIVNNSGYKSVQGFMRVYKKVEGEVLAYQKAMEQYRTRGGQKPPEEESIREQLRRLTEEGKRSEIDRKVKVKKEKGAR